MLLPENGFAAVLHQAWLRAGQPSMRALARTSGRSAQMVNSTLRGETLPRTWEDAAAVVEAVVTAGVRASGWSDAAQVRDRCLDAYRRENESRVSVRSALRRGAEAEHRLDGTSSFQETGRGIRRPSGDRAVSEWSALELGVHRSIASLPSHAAVAPDTCAAGAPVPEQSQPAYAVRDHDRILRAVLTGALEGPVTAFLVGGSSTGKTRSAVEAVRAVMPDWRLVFPTTARSLRSFLEAEPEPTRTVIWLDELQMHLDGPAGEQAAAALRELHQYFRGPVAVVGTIWPRFWRQLVGEPKVAVRDKHQQARRLLRSVHRVNVPGALTDRELRHVRQLARKDSRIRAALSAAGDTGALVQNLAGGPALIEAYEDNDAPVRAVLTAAMDLWRLGYRSPIPQHVLEIAASGYFPERQAPPGPRWFAAALGPACEAVKGAIAPLDLVDDGEQSCYRLADYLAQHGYQLLHGRSPAAALWDALARTPPPAEDAARLASAASSRGYYRYADLLWGRLASTGDTAAMRRLAELCVQLDRGSEAAAWWQRAAAAGDREAESQLGGTADEEAEDTGRIDGRTTDEGDESDESEEGDEGDEGENWLARVLEDSGQNMALAEWHVHTDRQRAERSSAEPGVPNPTDGTPLGSLPPDAPIGRSPAGEGAWHLPFVTELLDNSSEGAELERAWVSALTAGDDAAVLSLMEQLGPLVAERMTAREAQLRMAARTGAPADLWALAGLLEGTGRVEEAEAIWQRAAESGDAEAMWRLADLMVKADRLSEARGWWRRAADTDSDTGMMVRLVSLLRRAGLTQDADRLTRYGRDADGRPAAPWYD
ncbi:hypothetical protein [Streptomyces zhihengii]